MHQLIESLKLIDDHPYYLLECTLKDLDNITQVNIPKSYEKSDYVSLLRLRLKDLLLEENFLVLSVDVRIVGGRAPDYYPPSYVVIQAYYNNDIVKLCEHQASQLKTIYCQNMTTHYIRLEEFILVQLDNKQNELLVKTIINNGI